MPRSVTSCKNYKASEFLQWLLNYSVPILIKYLPDNLFQHWILLVMAVFILLKKKILKTEVQKAELLIRLFVRDIANLYKDRMLVYNVHQLLHLSLYVSRWGPLWATSAFPFENYNGFLANSLHGTHNVKQELINSVKMYEGYLILKNKIVDIQPIRVEESMKVLGQKIKSFKNINVQLFERLGHNINELQIYSRVFMKGIIYTSQLHKTLKTNTYTVNIEFNDNTNMYGFVKFYFVKSSIIYIYLQPLHILHTSIIYHKESGAILDHILPFKETDIPHIIDSRLILHMSIVTQVNNYICKSPNLLRKVL